MKCWAVFFWTTLLLLPLITVEKTKAETFHWAGVENNPWNDPDAWRSSSGDRGKVPGPQDIAIIGLQGPTTLTAPRVPSDLQEPIEVGEIHLFHNASAELKLIILGTLICNGQMTINAPILGNGELTVKGQLQIFSGHIGNKATPNGNGLTLNTFGKLSFSNQEVFQFDKCTLNIFADATWEMGSADLHFIDSNRINIMESGTFGIHNRSTLSSEQGSMITINNRGELIKEFPDAPPEKDDNGGSKFFNTIINNAGGLLNLSEGSIQIDNRGLPDEKFDVIQTSGAIKLSSTFTKTGFEKPTHLNANVKMDGGTLNGNGEIGSFFNENPEQNGLEIQGGIMTVGKSPGVMIVRGSYLLGPASTLNCEVGGTSPGTEHDQIIVGAIASIVGTINISLINVFSPGTGDHFDIIAAAISVSGPIATENLPASLTSELPGQKYVLNAVPDSVAPTVTATDVEITGMVSDTSVTEILVDGTLIPVAEGSFTTTIDVTSLPVTVAVEIPSQPGNGIEVTITE